MTWKLCLPLELLEPRIAPASLTFVDADGDNVVVLTSKGSNSELAAAAVLTETSPGSGRFQLEALDLGANPVFSKTTLQVMATRAPGDWTGDGLVHVGRIDAAGIVLGKVTIEGDLGRILVGTGQTGGTALSALSVFSLGSKGISTGAPDLVSEISGSVGSVRIETQLNGATFSLVTAGAKMSSLWVGADIIGGSDPNSGRVSVPGALGKVFVGGDLIGGSGDGSGTVEALSFSQFRLGGSVIGGSGLDSGKIEAVGTGRSLGSLTVGGDITGGTGEGSGGVAVAGTLQTLVVGGSLVGGDGDNSGQVTAEVLSSLSHKQSIFGKAGSDSGRYDLGSLGKGTVGGNIFGGTGTGSGGILADTKIGSLVIRGSLFGTDTADTGTVDVGPAGTIDQLTVQGSQFGGAGEGSGSVAAGSIGKGTWQGSLFGGSGNDSGAVVLSHGFGKLAFGQDLSGGSGEGSGSLHITANGSAQVGSLSIDGRLAGAAGTGSGSVLAPNAFFSAKSLIIGGSIQGGQGNSSGRLAMNGHFSTVDISGGIEGGSGDDSGSILLASAGKFTIGGNVRGGLSSSGSGSLVIEGSLQSLRIDGGVSGGTNQTLDVVTDSGAVLIGGNLKTLHVGRSITAGNANTPDDLNLGAVRVGGSLGSAVVQGSIVGNDSQYAFVTAKGTSGATGKNSNAIGSLQVNGEVRQAWILAGYDTSGTAINGDGGDLGGSARIGTVAVVGNWTAASLAAGVSTGIDGAWGSASNAPLTTSTPDITASISKIVIRGTVQGLPSGQNGIVTERIDQLSIAGESLPLPPAPFSTQIGSLATQEVRLVV
ncbi:MAG: hypothetical protein Fur0032_07900 [Terrimicrobiaceae bacterium]